MADAKVAVLKGTLVYIWIVGLVLNPVSSYPDGASSKACGHLTPGHGIAQLSPSPYTIEVPTDTYRAGAIIPVTIKGPPYAGFILQAQIVSTRTVVGTWADPPINTKIMKCSRDKDTMTHSSTMAKHNAVFRWIAPDYDVHRVEFIATVAPSKELWWRNIKSSDMTYDPEPVTPFLPTFPPSIVPYTQDFDLAFPFQTKSPDVIDSNFYDSYEQINKLPIDSTVIPSSVNLPVIKIPDNQNIPDSQENRKDDYQAPNTPYLPPFPQRPERPDITDIVTQFEPITQKPAYFDSSNEQIGPPHITSNGNNGENAGYKAEDSIKLDSYTANDTPNIDRKPNKGVTDTVINVTPDRKANDDGITRDEGAEFPSRINTDGSQYHQRRRPFRRPRPPPEPWLGPGPDGHIFNHPWQRFSGWHGPRYLHWQNNNGASQGYQSWPFNMPTGRRAAVAVPGIYEYRYYYKR